MNENKLKLATLKSGDHATVTALSTATEHSSLVARLMEMGLTVGTSISIEHEAPFGGAIAVRCRGTLIALRLSDAEKIEVKLK